MKDLLIAALWCWLMAALIVLYLSIVNCGGVIQEPALKPYLDNIVQLCKDYQCGKELEIQNQPLYLGNLNENTEDGAMMGYCDNGITIDKAYWSKLNEISRQLLIIHEVGHCVFKKQHNDSEIDIMNSEQGEPLYILYKDNSKILLDRYFVND